MRLIQSSEEEGGDYIAGSPLFFYIVVPMIKKSTIKSCYSDLKLGNSHKYNCKSSLFFSQSLSITFQTESNLQGFTGLFSDYLYRRSQFVRLYSGISREKLMVVYELIISVNQIGEKLSDDSLGFFLTSKWMQKLVKCLS